MRKLKHIDKIGIELEGAWAHKPVGLVNDISVNIPGATYYGEVPSPPMKLEEVEPFIKAFCPNLVNHTCGLHIHCSFKDNANVMLTLMDKKFYDYFLLRMDDFGRYMKFPKTHDFWKRLNDQNRFCRRLFQPEIQIKSVQKDNNRRTHLNFCWSMHKTLECRLFPAFSDPNCILSAVEVLVDCYETYLDKNAQHLVRTFEETIVEESLIEE